MSDAIDVQPETANRPRVIEGLTTDNEQRTTDKRRRPFIPTPATVAPPAELSRVSRRLSLMARGLMGYGRSIRISPRSSVSPGITVNSLSKRVEAALPELLS